MPLLYRAITLGNYRIWPIVLTVTDPLKLFMGQHSNQPPAPDAKQIHQQASDWLLILNDNATEQQQQQFSSWLQQSAEHQRIWQQTLRAWKLMGQLPQSATHSDPGKLQPLPVRSRPWLRVAIAACLILAIWPGVALYWQADAITGKGETQIITLEDGSQVYLGADSALAVNFQQQQRAVTLLQGQAYFQVSHNPQRPFVVTSNQLQVKVLGTEFDVEAGDEHSYVGVASGLVSVTQGKQQQQVHPGQLLNINTHGGMQAQQLDSELVAPWREQRLFVHNRPVVDVIASLQRYYSGLIVLQHDELKKKRVTGSYQLQHIDDALDALVRPYGAEVIHISPYLRIITRS